MAIQKRAFVNRRASMPIPTSAETEAIARQLAAMRGQTVEEVVSVALRAELMRERESRSAVTSAELTPTQRAKVEHVMELVRAAGPAGTGEDPTAFLYDDQGLPS
jgi:hypothetical protein